MPMTWTDVDRVAGEWSEAAVGLSLCGAEAVPDEPLARTLMAVGCCLSALAVLVTDAVHTGDARALDRAADLLRDAATGRGECTPLFVPAPSAN